MDVYRACVEYVSWWHAGHLVVKKTHDRLCRHSFGFIWRNMLQSIVKLAYNLLSTLYCSVVGRPFEHLILDCVGPLIRSKAWNDYMLTVMFKSTHYPAAFLLAFPLKALTTSISTFGVPKVIQTDWGSHFMSHFCKGSGCLGLNIRCQVRAILSLEEPWSVSIRHWSLCCSLAALSFLSIGKTACPGCCLQ